MTKMRLFVGFRFPCLVELSLHGRVLVSKLTDGQLFGVLIGQSEVVFGAEEAFLYLEQIGDGVDVAAATAEEVNAECDLILT